ncbi:hypothetical protein AC578_7039 [Pseudocercospora eumusae]|uniref:Uncharacterized protein n=1 Tax=Pseudocercospora eumusae TaxID=321146 RepID=A0A139GVW9_9PEZI|nr:hypothetical protein AC578_7039 [Pseudocercospora eumusae]
MSGSKELDSLDCSENDDDSLSSYTIYSSAASDDDSPEADEKRRIRQELDDAAFAELAEERAKERKERHKELLSVIEEWLCAFGTHSPKARVEVLEEYFYDQDIPWSFWQPA